MTSDTKIVKSGKCGNSPKNAFVEDFTIWLMTADQENLRASFSPDGAVRGDGLQPIIGLIAKMNPMQITIFEAISHGRVGAVHGELTLDSGPTDFSVFLEFQNTKAERVSKAKVFLGSILGIGFNAR